MLKKDFWYDLPKELIAQEPADPRDSARLMVLSQKDDSIQHKIFHDLPDYLEPGDLLVVNNSKVLPARIVGIKQPTGAVCELLLLRQVKGDQWECLAKPGKRMQPGTKVSFGDGSLTAVVDETLEDGNKYVTFYYDTETLYEKLDEFGKMPLPPYITKQLEDQSQYQTVYAKELGSAAAPTAGLHFTPELMDTIRAKGVNIAEVTLHVGLGTFRPVQEDEITDHKMHSEWYCIDEKTAQMIRDTKAAGHRVIAVAPPAAARWKLLPQNTVRSVPAAATPPSSCTRASSSTASTASSPTSICRKAPSSCWCRPCTATKRPWQLIRLPFRNVTDFSLLVTPWPSCNFITVLSCIFAKRDEIFCG